MRTLARNGLILNLICPEDLALLKSKEIDQQEECCQYSDFTITFYDVKINLLCLDIDRNSISVSRLSLQLE